MEIRTTEEARKNIETFTKRLANLLQDKKNIDADIKELKREFKEEGVPVAVVSKVFNKIKANKNKTDSQLFEEETIQEWLETNTEIDDAIGRLAAKD